jgi:hypothetical protein
MMLPTSVSASMTTRPGPATAKNRVMALRGGRFTTICDILAPALIDSLNDSADTKTENDLQLQICCRRAALICRIG